MQPYLMFHWKFSLFSPDPEYSLRFLSFRNLVSFQFSFSRRLCFAESGKNYLESQVCVRCVATEKEDSRRLSVIHQVNL